MDDEIFMKKAYIYSNRYSTNGKIKLKEYLKIRSEFKNNIELNERYRIFSDRLFKGIKL